jgi:hypothetical protein
MEESYFAFLNNSKKVYGDPSFENTLREIAAAGEAGARTRARSTGVSIPPVMASSPGTPAPSATSPTNRTPTARTPPGATPTGGPKVSPNPVTNPGGVPRNSANATTSASHSKLAPVRPGDNPALATPAASASSSPSTTIPPGQSSAALRPPPKPILPWIFLTAFLLAAAALLAFALLR